MSETFGPATMRMLKTFDSIATSSIEAVARKMDAAGCAPEYQSILFDIIAMQARTKARILHRTARSRSAQKAAA